MVSAPSGDAAATAALTALTGPGAALPLTAALKPGDPLGGRYRILRVLGAGGMGVVYQAWDDELGVAVALKVIRPEVMADPSSAQDVERRFKRELLLARQVTHKNVVRIHDISEVNGIKYLTMPFVDGRDLASILREAGTLPVDRVLRFAKQIAAGLQAAHDAGVVHRDLKPENIMIDADDQAMIMDFGISRSLTGTGAGTVMGAVVGTLEYMSPEQGRGVAADQRSDIYAFGLMLYDMLAGRQRQLTSDSAVAELMSRMTQPPPPLRTRAAHVPAALEAIVARCVDPDVTRRYQTTAELVAALEALDADGRPVVAAVPRKRPVGIAAAAALVLALGAGGGWWWSSGRDRSAAPAAARDPVSVLIADFDNQAKEPVFDGALEQVLGIEMEGASFITVFSRRDAARIAPQIAKGARGIDLTTGRLIARREAVAVLVAGSIARQAEGYRLEVFAEDPVAGTEITRTSETVRDKTGVLPAVGKLAKKLRAALGDASADLERTARAETFTAGTIEAAHAYGKAQELSWAGQTDAAIAHYEEAIRLDPDLGRAYSGLAALYSNQGKEAEAAKYYELALARVDRMTEREKYRTRCGYYLFAREPAKAIEECQELVRLYPSDSAGLANFAVAMVYERRMTQALELGRRAVAIYPRNIVRRSNAALFAMYAGDFAAAEAEAGETLKLKDDYPRAHLTLAIVHLANGRRAEADATWRKLARMTGGAAFATAGLVDLAMFEGRLQDAVALLEAPDNGFDEARRLATLAEVRLAQGNRDAAAAAAAAAVKGTVNPFVLYLAGRVLAETQRTQAARIAESMRKTIDREARIHGALLAGEIALTLGDRQAAHDAFTEAQKFADTWLGRFGLARTALAAGSFADADRNFEVCLSRRGEVTAVFLDEIPTYRLVATLYYYIGVTQAGQNRPAWRDTLNTFLSFKAKGDEQGLVADARRRLQTR